MKGQYLIDIQNRSVRFKLKIKRNITIIQGDSATGKSTLIRMIRDFAENGQESGVSLSCDRPCIVVDDLNWESLLRKNQNAIVFIDEGAKFINELDFARTIQNSTNYFVIVTRTRLPYLTYSVDEIYALKNTTKTRYKNYTVVHTQQNKIYDSHLPGKIPLPECVIVEDSKSGFQFFSAVFSTFDIPVVSAQSNANIYNTILERKERNLLVIADGAAFGQEIERVKYLKRCKNLILYLPESFEWLILKSQLFNRAEINKILETPFDYIKSEEFYTWERFFTHLLIQESQSIVYLNYNKANLNSAYLDQRNKQAIVDVMPEISNDV